MSKREFFLCDGCGLAIVDTGIMVTGNISAMEGGDVSGGLIGSKLPEPDGEGRIIATELKSKTYCVPCFYKAFLREPGITTACKGGL